MPASAAHVLRRLLFGLQVSELLLPASSQQIGKVALEEQHPPMPVKHCTKKEGCTAEETSLTLDAGRRWLHEVSDKKTGLAVCGGLGNWNATLCPDGKTCAGSCALEGLRRVDYEEAYGVISIPDGVQINYVTHKVNIGSRLYLLDEDQEKYKLFNLKNREFTFDVDVSMLECGMNAALYFVEMPADGGSSMGNNKAGAKYGLGYCDAQCPHGLNFINGEANMQGAYGACCTEMDVWEANRITTSMTLHPCSTVGLHRCEGVDCGDGDKEQYYLGVCDKDGCEFNPYRMGNTSLYGPKQMVDTDKQVTVVTQFLTEDGTDAGALSEIRRFYIQDGHVIQNSKSIVAGITGDSITAPLCTAEKRAFVQTRDVSNMQGDYNQFDLKGGLGQMSKAFDRGMVLALALWDDPAVKMQWLDGFLPNHLPQGTLGALRGPCKPEWGTPQWMRENIPDAHVQFANIRFGEIGSTTGQGHKPSEEVHSTGADNQEPSGGKDSAKDHDRKPSEQVHSTRADNQQTVTVKNFANDHDQKPSEEKDSVKGGEQKAAGKSDPTQGHNQQPAEGKDTAKGEDQKIVGNHDSTKGHSQQHSGGKDIAKGEDQKAAGKKNSTKGHDQQPSRGKDSTMRHDQQPSGGKAIGKGEDKKAAGKNDSTKGHDQQPTAGKDTAKGEARKAVGKNDSTKGHDQQLLGEKDIAKRDDQKAAGEKDSTKGHDQQHSSGVETAKAKDQKAAGETDSTNRHDQQHSGGKHSRKEHSRAQGEKDAARGQDQKPSGDQDATPEHDRTPSGEKGSAKGQGRKPAGEKGFTNGSLEEIDFFTERDRNVIWSAVLQSLDDAEDVREQLAPQQRPQQHLAAGALVILLGTLVSIAGVAAVAYRRHRSSSMRTMLWSDDSSYVPAPQCAPRGAFEAA